MEFPDGHIGWLATGYDSVQTVLADQKFSSRQELHHHAIYDHPFGKEKIAPAAPGFFIGMDAPEHERYRRLLTGRFTQRRIGLLGRRVEEIAERLLDTMEAKPRREADLVSEYAQGIPTQVICELLGVPTEHEERFQGAVYRFFHLGSGAEDSQNAYQAILEYLNELVAWRRTSPGDDILSELIATGELDKQELAAISLLLLVAGYETTANMIGLGVFALLMHPDQLALLLKDESRADGAVEELLRFLPLFRSGTRTALHDTDLAGRRISADECVAFSLTSANRDPRRYGEDADRLDITRRATGHLAFGHGAHRCLGSQLARLEMRIAYTRLFRRFPTLKLAVPPEEIPSRDDMIIHGVHRLPVSW